jgi:hypothetical protein
MSLCSFRVSAKPQLDSQQEIIKNSTEIVLMFFLMIEPTGMTTAAP